MKTKVAAFGIAIIVCLAWLNGKTSLAFPKSNYQQELHQTYPVSGNGKLSLDNVNGTIHISAWDQAQIKVDAIKHADHEADLEDLKIEVEAASDLVRIRTQYPHSKWGFRSGRHSTSVDYEVKVPAGTKLDNIQNVNGRIEIEGVRGAVHATTVNGRLSVEGLRSDAELESVNGSVRAEFDNFDSVKSVALKTVNGRVEIDLPTGANADVSANTLNGRIETGPELPVKKHWPVGTDLHHTLGKGGAHVRAETVNGSIHIQVADRPGRKSPTATDKTEKPEQE